MPTPLTESAKVKRKCSSLGSTIPKSRRTLKMASKMSKQDNSMQFRQYAINDTFSIIMRPAGNPLPKGEPNTLGIVIDDWFNYSALTHYHGPSSIIDVLRFRSLVNQFLKTANSQQTISKHVCVITDVQSPKRTNAAFLIGSYLILELGMGANITNMLLSRAATSMPSYGTAGVETMQDHIELIHCFRGLQTFARLGLFDPDELCPDETETLEHPDNGDMNWIIPGKLLALAGPCNQSINSFISFAKEKNIKGIVRLNDEWYETAKLEKAQIAHLEISVEDGSIPSFDQIRQFYAFANRIINGGNGGALAVHCRAGLGRTGTMIGSYLIRKYKIDAKEVVAFMRIMRPGCFLNRQPRFMEAIQYWLMDKETTSVQKTFIIGCLGPVLAKKLSLPFCFLS